MDSYPQCVTYGLSANWKCHHPFTRKGTSRVRIVSFALWNSSLFIWLDIYKQQSYGISIDLNQSISFLISPFLNQPSEPFAIRIFFHSDNESKTWTFVPSWSIKSNSPCWFGSDHTSIFDEKRIANWFWSKRAFLEKPTVKLPKKSKLVIRDKKKKTRFKLD